jgi:hypothetical protein
LQDLTCKIIVGSNFFKNNNKNNLGSKLSLRYGAEEDLHHTSKFFGLYANSFGGGDFGSIDFQ